MRKTRTSKARASKTGAPADGKGALDITTIAEQAGMILSMNMIAMVFGVPIALTGLGSVFAEEEGWWLIFLIFAGAGAAILRIIQDYGRLYWRAWQVYAIILIGGIVVKLIHMLLAGEVLYAIVGGAMAVLPMVFLGATLGGSSSLLSTRIEMFDAKLVDVLAASRSLFTPQESAEVTGGRQALGQAIFWLGLVGALVFPAALLLSSIQDLTGLSMFDDWVTVGTLLNFALPVFGAMILFGRRLMQPAAKINVTGLDVRPTILLRAFKDDQREVKRKSDISIILSLGFEKLGFKPNIRLEKAIADELWRIGPFYGVGYPGEDLPKLGAAKISLADGEWQDVVQGWIRDCRLIVIIAGRSNWLAWELGQVIRYNAVDKLLILLPPDQPKARRERWKAITSCFKGTPFHPAVGAADTTEALAAWFRRDGTLGLIRSKSADQESFAIVVRLAAYDIVASAPVKPRARPHRNPRKAKPSRSRPQRRHTTRQCLVESGEMWFSGRF